MLNNIWKQLQRLSSTQVGNKNTKPTESNATVQSDVTDDVPAKESKREEAWSNCIELARQPNILEMFMADLSKRGVVGEEKVAKLLYLSVTSRLIEKPVSVAVKGPSSCGKSHVTEQVLKFFPENAFYALTSMSPHALPYADVSLAHRMLVIYEADGMLGEKQQYFLRTLLSEGRIRHQSIANVDGKRAMKTFELEGPTGLIVTTTQTSLHPENETRLLSVTTDDTPEQTQAILVSLADEYRDDVDLAPWHSLQTWLELSDLKVEIPYLKALFSAIPPIAPRVRRDAGIVMNLIKAHAILHQYSRERNDVGRILATYDDYAAIHGLVRDYLGQGIEAMVDPNIRETVEALKQTIDATSSESVTVTQVAEVLGLDKSTALRRVRKACEAGYIENLQHRKGQQAELVLGEPLPADIEILPSVETLQTACTPHT